MPIAVLIGKAKFTWTDLVEETKKTSRRGRRSRHGADAKTAAADDTKAATASSTATASKDSKPAAAAAVGVASVGTAAANAGTAGAAGNPTAKTTAAKPAGGYGLTDTNFLLPVGPDVGGACLHVFVCCVCHLMRGIMSLGGCQFCGAAWWWSAAGEYVIVTWHTLHALAGSLCPESPACKDVSTIGLWTKKAFSKCLPSLALWRLHHECVFSLCTQLRAHTCLIASGVCILLCL